MKLLDKIKEAKIYGIIRSDDPNYAIEVAKAYIEGGLKLLEINAPANAVKEIAKIDDVIVAQGGIITTSQAHAALNNGAKIISSPIFQTNLVRFASCYKAFLIPSTATPNETYSAWMARIPLIKIYPVSEMGGVEYIRDLIKPMPFLNLLPCGFVKLDEVEKYLSLGVCAVGLGRELYAKNNYTEIVQTAREVMKMVR